MIDSFAHIIGNDRIKSCLVSMVRKNAIAHSLLFAGPDGVGKSLFAEALARLLLGPKVSSGHHPDLHHYRPEGKIGMHSIDTMRQFHDEVYLPPYESKRKVFILHDANRMLPWSANALLKTFEEPLKDTIIILLSSHPSALLPTILSRCCTLNFQLLNDQQVKDYLVLQKGCDSKRAESIAFLAKGSIGQAMLFLEQEADCLRSYVLEMLSCGRFKTYSDLLGFVKEVAKYVERAKTQAEGPILQEQEFEMLPSALQDQISKEIDGAIRMKQHEESKTLFHLFLGWFRDLHLLRANGNRHKLWNPDYHEAMEQILQRGNLLPLEEVQQAVIDASLSLERSTSFSICLENLLLRLQL